MTGFGTFVALGDSVTEGVGDVVEGFPAASAHDHLAARLRETNPALEYVNLARRGLTCREIRETQLAAAVALRPDLVSVIAGANDLLLRRWNPATFAEDFAALLGAFPEATRFTMTLPDFSRRVPMPPAVQARFREQWAQANDLITRLAGEAGTMLIAPAALAADADDVWSADHVHPNSRGYALIGAELARAVGLD